MSRLWWIVLTLSLAVDVSYQAINVFYGCPVSRQLNMHNQLPSEAALNADLSSIAAQGPLFYSRRINFTPKTPKPETKPPLVVVLPLNSAVASDASGLAVMLSLARWAKDRAFLKPVRFVVREGNIPTAEENSAESILMIGTLGHFSTEENSQTYGSMFPNWFSRRADYVAFLSNEGARGLTNVAVGLFSAACSLSLACVKTTRPGLSLFPAFNQELNASVPTVLVTDTALYRPHATLNVKRLSEIIGGLEAVIEGIACGDMAPVG